MREEEAASLLRRLPSIMAGSARTPGGFGLGCTRTLPFSTRTLKVGIFSANGGGDAPVSGRYWYPCHGQVMQPSRILPSPRGPFWCWQALETAEILPLYLKMATRSPLRQTMRARFSGISETEQTWMKSIFDF